MNKKVAFSPKPQRQLSSNDTEEWVAKREISEPVEEMKRLTIDVTLTLHTAIKTECAKRGVKMADEIRYLLETHFFLANNLSSNTEILK